MLARLLYASRAPREIDQSLIDPILEQSRRFNPKAGVTGILCYSGNIFIQVLEGNRRVVSQLYNRIVTDSRHTDIEILHFEEISERRFSNWTMGQVNIAKLNPSILLKYSETPEFNPFSMGGQFSMALLEELIATASIVTKT